MHRVWNAAAVVLVLSAASPVLAQATDREAIRALEHVIEIAQDGVDGFHEAAEHVKDKDAKEHLKRYGLEREEFISRLDGEIVRLGGHVDEEGTAGGAAHRTWINLRAALEHDDEDAILSEVQRGEEAALKAYDEALQKDLPPETHQLLFRQRDGVQRIVDWAKTQRAAMKAEQKDQGS